MNVHLIRSNEISRELYRDVINILQNFSGPFKFISSEDVLEYEDDDFIVNTIENENVFDTKNAMYHRPPSGMMGLITFPHQRRELTWEQLFNKCSMYRKTNDIGVDEFVILLTDIANDMNWFSMIDENLRDGFIHTDKWDFYIDTDPKYPIAYQVMELLLLSLTLKDINEVNSIAHEKPKGCIFDFTGNKKDVTLKLRTADICPECQRLISGRNVSVGAVNQVLLTIEGIRKQMLFKERFKYHLQPSRMVFNVKRKELSFSDIENLKLHLNPLQATIYYFFLIHEDGEFLNNLYSYEDELYRIYKKFSIHANSASMHDSIEELVDSVGGSFVQKKSKLNRKLQQVLGNELARHYEINRKGRNYPFKISINRDLVTIEEE